MNTLQQMGFVCSLYFSNSVAKLNLKKHLSKNEEKVINVFNMLIQNQLNHMKEITFN